MALTHRTYKRRTITLKWENVPSIVWLFLIVFGALALDRTGLVAYIVVALWTLRGPGEAIEGLLASLMLVLFNPGLADIGSQATIWRWLILVLAAMRVFYAWGKEQPIDLTWKNWFKYIVIFVFIVGIGAIFISELPSLSIVKLVAYLLTIVTTYLGVRLGEKNWSATFVGLALLITFASIPVLFSPAGYLRSHWGFQGIFNHPQTFGVFLAIPFAMVVGRWVVDEDSRLNLSRTAGIVLMAIMVYLTGSRAAYLSLIVAIAVVLFVRGDIRNLVKRLLFQPLTYFVLVALILLVSQIDDPRKELQLFLLKREATVQQLENFTFDSTGNPVILLYDSRSRLIDSSWKNFRTNPWWGIGFGVPSDPAARYVRTQFLGIPTSLPAEKGFIISAILEEVGLLGAMLLLLVLLAQLRQVWRSESASYLLLFLSALFVNLGESIYFAVGGLGLLMHIAFAVALVHSRHR